MIFIQKKPETLQKLEDWKEQENDVLEFYYNSNDATSAWNHLPSSPPRKPEQNVFYYSKSELKGELLKEQFFICAYCMDRLEQDHKCTIDHVVPKSINARLYTFDYNNLVATCSGSAVIERDGKGRRINAANRHCNNKKAEQDILVSPLQEGCAEKFTFTEEGEILGNDVDANLTIEVLGLDCEKLIIARRNAIRSVIYNDSLDDIQHISDAEMLIRLQEIQVQGKIKTPFWGAKEFILKLYLNI